MWIDSPSGVIVNEDKKIGTAFLMLLGLYGVVSEFFAIYPTQDVTPVPLLHLVSVFHYGAKVLKVFIWAFLLVNLGETIKKSNDSKIKRKFEISKQLSILIPVFIIFTSIFCQFVTSFDTFARSLKKSQSNESVIVNALENSVHYGFVFGLVQNMAYFIIPLINISLIYIWREDKVNENEDINEIELGNFHDRNDYAKDE